MENLENKVEGRGVESIATFVHGVLGGFHTLGIVYNLKKKNYVDVAIHTAAAVYDIYATIKHYKASRE